jgi:hypothetical protein
MAGNLRELIPAFFIGPGGQPLSQEEIARRREVAMSLLGKATDTSPNAGGGASVLAKAIQGLSYGINEGRADRAATANSEQSQANLLAMLGGGGGMGNASAFPPAPSAEAISVLSEGAPVPSGAAPSTVNLSGSQQEFISALLPAAIEESKRTGIDPRIIVAQAAQETGWGRAAPGNNYFGIKSHGQGGGQTLGTHEYVNGKRVNVRDSFRTFASPADSVRGYGDFILQNPRYKPLMAAQGLDAQLQALQASGYATDPNYSRSVGAIARGIQLPAVDAVNQFASGGAAPRPASIDDQMAQELLARQPEGASPYSGPGATIAPGDPERMAFDAAQRERDALTASTPQWLNEAIIGGNVGVAETEEDILAQEAMLSGDPAFSLAVEGEQAMPPVAPEPVLGMEPEAMAPAEIAMNDPAFAGSQGVLAANGRPMIQNPDGTVSTEESITITDPRINGGAPTNIPSIWGGRRTVSEDEAIEEALRSGQSFDAFPSIDAAVAAAQERSNMLGRSVPPAPVVAPQVAQALTGAQVNEALPMAGGANNVAPVINAAPSNPMAGLNPAVIQSLSNPNATPQERAVAQSLLQQHVAQNQALQAQAQEAAQRAQTLAQRRGLAGQLGVNPDFAGDENVWKAATEASFRDPQAVSAGSYIRNRDGTLEQIPESRTGDIQEYEYAKQNGYQGSFTDYQQETRRAAASQTNIDLGGEKFEQEFAKGDAAALAEVASAGMAAQRNLGRISALEQSLANAPSGMEARFKQMAGEMGIPTEGLSEIQAATAMINSLVPEQRPPGSGPMSDADLELFKQSLPRIINQPGGNAMIINTMRGVAQYDAQGAAIVQQLRAGEITRAQAFQMLQARQNPLDGFKAPAAQGGAGAAPAGVDPSDWEFMTPEERALFQ